VNELIGWRLRDGGAVGAKSGDGVEQSPSMPDQGDTKILQILWRQAVQHSFVDLVFAERLLVLLEPETAEPCCNIQARIPDAVVNAVLK